MSSYVTTAGVRVEFFARSELPSVVGQRPADVSDRLDQLVQNGVIDAREEHTWQAKVPVGGSTVANERYSQFREWAADAGVSLEPFFDTRECYSAETGEYGTKLVLPALALVIYRDGQLESVYPHATTQDTRTVMDGIRALESTQSPVEDDPDREELFVEPAE